MLVEFLRGDTRRYQSLLHRRDGVVVSFEGGSYNRIGGPAPELPHDAAHLLVETALDLRGGVWGTLAAGGLFRHATVVAGRQKPHARERGLALVKSARTTIMEAEFATRAACDALAAGKPVDPPDLADALRGAAATWHAMTPGGRMALELPDAWG